MYFQTARLSAEHSASGQHCTIDGHTRLADVTESVVSAQYSYLLVKDDRGKAIGVVAKEDLRRKLFAGNPLERRRWLEMPVEAALQGRMHIQPALESPSSVSDSQPPINFTAVSEEGRLIAVVTDNDVLVSWRSIEETLSLAQNDAVTMLPNRAAFEVHLKAEFDRARRTGHSLAVILVDVDCFKSINDRLGHSAGDSVLNAVGRSLRRTLRSYDMVARYGGDEFAVICCGCLPGEIDATLNHIQSAVRRLSEDPGVPQPVPTVSMGACVAHDFTDCPSSAVIIEHADECLYVAKRAGRDCAFSTEIGLDPRDVPDPRMSMHA